MYLQKIALTLQESDIPNDQFKGANLTNMSELIERTFTNNSDQERKLEKRNELRKNVLAVMTSIITNRQNCEEIREEMSYVLASYVEGLLSGFLYPNEQFNEIIYTFNILKENNQIINFLEEKFLEYFIIRIKNTRDSDLLSHLMHTMHAVFSLKSFLSLIKDATIAPLFNTAEIKLLTLSRANAYINHSFSPLTPGELYELRQAMAPIANELLDNMVFNVTNCDVILMAEFASLNDRTILKKLIELTNAISPIDILTYQYNSLCPLTLQRSISQIAYRRAFGDTDNPPKDDPLKDIPEKYLFSITKILRLNDPKPIDVKIIQVILCETIDPMKFRAILERYEFIDSPEMLEVFLLNLNRISMATGEIGAEVAELRDRLFVVIAEAENPKFGHLTFLQKNAPEKINFPFLKKLSVCNPLEARIVITETGKIVSTMEEYNSILGRIASQTLNISEPWVALNILEVLMENIIPRETYEENILNECLLVSITTIVRNISENNPESKTVKMHVNSLEGALIRKLESCGIIRTTGKSNNR